MSQDFLSQDEVDALLKGVTGEADDAVESDEPQAGVRSYDLATQERIVRGRMPTLELIHERFARYLRLGLFNLIQRSAEVSVGPIRVQKYSEFVRHLVVPTNLNLVHMKPLRGTALVVFEPNLVFLVIDNLFGSDGRFHTRVEGRDFTATEQRIIHRLLKTVFAEYEKAWAPVYALQCEYLRSEMNSQFANIATPSEVVVATTFQLEIGGITAEMHTCIPYSMVEPIRELLYSSLQSDHITSDQRWTHTLTRQLQEAEVELVAQFGQRRTSLRDIAALKIGDIVPIEVPDLVEAGVGGVPVLSCRFGVRNGHMALQVDEILGADPGAMMLHALPASD
ncbi:MAG: Flagellar motor switch protein FliM [Rhodocyclaceae bacterium]|nr:flagellar motor switch protein FliM [Rhodocyclaceae bacterium]MCG3187593.1 Flagellar motor switch protein FliM [Rhodocyclaceae bacterium]